MYSREFYTFCSVILLSFACLSASAFSTKCPSMCQCYSTNSTIGDEKTWNCSNLESPTQPWKIETIKYDSGLQSSHENVKHLIIQDSKIENSEALLQIFSKASFNKLSTLEISNSLINCTQQLVWLLELSGKIVDPENFICTSPQTLNGTQVFKALQLLHDVDSGCPERCTCELTHVPKDDQFDVTVTVSCNNLGFTELPQNLPVNVTIHMDLSNNRIDDVSKLASNPSYSRVRVLYLANNRIQSITSLQNSEWINQFSLLSLQGNLLQEIPTQELGNVFLHQDVNGIRMFLSNNPWKCDCITITHFQPFIAKHKQLIKDVSNVTCGPDEGEIAGNKIISIELSSVCDTDENSAVNLWDVLSVVFAILTIMTIGKLLYDYHAYRKTGRLPWIASKLP